ncbi:hypothetical protein M6D81_15405 [Paenibacillus sp. J5C_2022]|uniref:hypothetical protein n=1 Tax=Paenibacillus sp. J5C2022 TaxID=2977129 RepID=UPI0021D17318|nr:hypothetical protein [Paenibacillus sp. J5C2022]MCU6710083.1 hypothetical protein [Paenibacillus sp. J5C2022]
MGVPATTGKLATSLSGMKVGDYVVCHYQASSGIVGTFSNLGSAVGTEIPVSSTNAPNGIFYYIKVDKGLLIADRVIQHSISWDTLNSGKYIQGKSQTFGSLIGKIRLLTGGVAYADENGNISVTDLGFGAWPTNNEWDKYIVRFPSNLMQSGSTLDDIFHSSSVIQTWTQDTPSVSIFPSSNRVRRGYRDDNSYNGNGASNTNVTSSGFRPAFEYKEV